MSETIKILTIQDISCYRQCSITVALPVISAFGIERVGGNVQNAHYLWMRKVHHLPVCVDKLVIISLYHFLFS